MLQQQKDMKPTAHIGYSHIMTLYFNKLLYSLEYFNLVQIISLRQSWPIIRERKALMPRLSKLANELFSEDFESYSVLIFDRNIDFRFRPVKNVHCSKFSSMRASISASATLLLALHV